MWSKMHSGFYVSLIAWAEQRGEVFYIITLLIQSAVIPNAQMNEAFSAE